MTRIYESDCGRVIEVTIAPDVPGVMRRSYDFKVLSGPLLSEKDVVRIMKAMEADECVIHNLELSQ